MRSYVDRERVRSVRTRFNEAKAKGASDEEASVYANGGPLNIVPKQPEPPPLPTEATDDNGDDDQKTGYIDEDAEPGAGASEGDEVAAEANADESGGDAKPDYSGVAIPPGWQEMPWPTMRKLAIAMSDQPIGTKDDAIRVISAEERRRKEAADAAEAAAAPGAG